MKELLTQEEIDIAVERISGTEIMNEINSAFNEDIIKQVSTYDADKILKEFLQISLIVPIVYQN